ncbi:MAG TPA: ATP-dependent DNA ligase [Casimicrobiaceae bacterium]|nr:ATP-dependent DNA ligase [Casimicrobiaceae bacterium]
MPSSALPLSTDYAPMEAKLVASLPTGEAWRYEPKWDGFRCLAFRDGDTVDLRSKSGQPFNRYFPELVQSLQALDARHFVLDGELVVPVDDTLSFDELLMRIHPAQSRVQKLAREHPVLYVLFDLLVDEQGRSLVHEPLHERRRALERFMAAHATPSSLLRLSPQTTDARDIEEWIGKLGAGLDGVIAKRADLPYQSGERTGMQKFKRMRTADCVVGGFRYGSNDRLVGSLLLGLYDDAGLLHHVGFSSNIKASDKPVLTNKLEKLVSPPGFTGRAPGGPSRWSSERTGEWEPLQPELVVEVQYDHFSGDRFRHGTKLLRFRPDKKPRQCTLAQVAQEASSTLALLDARPRAKSRR